MRRLIGLAVLGLALLQLGVRGSQRLRTDVPLWDFASVYSSSRAFLHGHNPYDMSAVQQTWREQNFCADRDLGFWTAVYPPCSLLTIAPFALMPARAATIAWFVLTMILLAGQFVALIDLARLHWRDPRCLILVGAALAAAPLQFGLLSGQLSLPAISLCVIAFWCVANNHEKLAGVLIGVACALKPQVGAPFIAYYFFRKQWRVTGHALLSGGSLCIISVIGMAIARVNWIAGWSHCVAASGSAGNVNDYGFANPFRDEMIDLKMIFVNLSQSAAVVRTVIECAVVALLVWLFGAIRTTLVRAQRTELLTLATLSAIVLLPVYHRIYDATLLTLALAWALAELDGKWRRFAFAILLPMLLMLVPFDLAISASNRLPKLQSILQTRWWQALIAPHYAWGLLAITVVLLRTLSLQAREQRAIGSNALNVELPVKPKAEPTFADDEPEESLAH